MSHVICHRLLLDRLSLRLKWIDGLHSARSPADVLLVEALRERWLIVTDGGRYHQLAEKEVLADEVQSPVRDQFYWMNGVHDSHLAPMSAGSAHERTFGG